MDGESMNEESIVIEVTSELDEEDARRFAEYGDPRSFGKTLGKLLRSRVDALTLLAICWAALGPAGSRDFDPAHMRAFDAFVRANGCTDEEVLRAKLNLATALLGTR